MDDETQEETLKTLILYIIGDSPDTFWSLFSVQKKLE